LLLPALLPFVFTILKCGALGGLFLKVSLLS